MATPVIALILGCLVGCAPQIAVRHESGFVSKGYDDQPERLVAWSIAVDPTNSTIRRVNWIAVTAFGVRAPFGSGARAVQAGGREFVLPIALKPKYKRPELDEKPFNVFVIHADGRLEPQKVSMTCKQWIAYAGEVKERSFRGCPVEELETTLGIHFPSVVP